MSDIVPANGALMSFIERAARDPDFDLVKFEAMLRLQREIEHEQQRRVFNADMAKVQEAIGEIKRSGKNPSFANPYAKLEDLDRAARPVYTGYGFNVRYGSRLSSPDAPPLLPGNTRMVLIISHSGGYTEEHHLDGPSDSQQGGRGRTPIQAIGSTATYLRRYLLQMVLNLVPAGDPADDDGEATRRPADDDAEVPLRAAAASMQRAPRVAEQAEAPERTDAQWQTWLDKLRAACEVLYHRSEVGEVAERATVADALATGPGWVRREISAILAENYKRFGEDEPASDLPEVEIAGSEKVMSG